MNYGSRSVSEAASFHASDYRTGTRQGDADSWILS